MEGKELPFKNFYLEKKDILYKMEFPNILIKETS